MPQKISVPFHLSRAPGTEAFETAYQVPAAKKFNLCEVEVIMTGTPAGKLQIAVYHGIRKVAPNGGVFQLGEGRTVARAEYTFNSGEKVLVWSKNTHDANTYDADVVLEGELT